MFQRVVHAQVFFHIACFVIVLREIGKQHSQCESKKVVARDAYNLATPARHLVPGQADAYKSLGMGRM
jgi:hypothetical protein